MPESMKAADIPLLSELNDPYAVQSVTLRRAKQRKDIPLHTTHSVLIKSGLASNHCIVWRQLRVLVSSASSLNII